MLHYTYWKRRTKELAIGYHQMPFPELKSQLQSQSSEYDHLAVKAAACGRTLAVTEQELRSVNILRLILEDP